MRNFRVRSMLPYAKNNEIYEADSDFEYNHTKEIKWYDYILLNRPLRIILGFAIGAIILPIILFQYVFASSFTKPPTDGYSTGSCLIPRGDRIVCGGGSRLSEECDPQCCYDEGNNICYHKFPSRFSYILNQPWTEDSDLNPRIAMTPYSNRYSLQKIRLSIDEISPSHMTINLYNPEETNVTASRISTKNYRYDISTPEINIEVFGHQGMLFNTLHGPLIAADDIWEISFKLTNETMFGFGEIPLVGNTVKLIYSHKSDPGLTPLIFAITNGSYHGLLIDAKSPTEVLIGETNQIHVRSLTKRGIKLHLFVGPEPEDIMKDVLKVLGFGNQLEYWMLGPHICTEPGTPGEAYNDLNHFITAASTAALPFDSHCGPMPIVFENRCNTEIKDVIKRGEQLLGSFGKRFVPYISPYVQQLNRNYGLVCNYYQKNETDFTNVMLKKNADDIYIGLVNRQDVVYPDYSKTNYEFMNKVLGFYDIKPAGVVLENTWPLDETSKRSNETFNHLPYLSQALEEAFENTPEWDVLRPDGEKLLYSHNEYGNHFSTAIRYHTGVPTWTTSHHLNGEAILNSQNIDASWSNLHREVINNALSGISGHWFRMSPICGDTDTFDPITQLQLCVKWYMAAAYFPMIKIYSKGAPRHPLAFSGTSKLRMQEALHRRMILLPYFNTVLREGPLLRPMFYQYPHSEGLKNLNTQFNVGDDILVVPNLLPDQRHVHFHMPPGSWFLFLDGLKIDGDEGDIVTLPTIEDDFFTVVRGGSIIPLQKNIKDSAEVTRYSSDLTLIIALDTNRCVSNISACGHLFITDNLILNFEADDIELTITATGDDYDAFCKNNLFTNIIKEIDVYGLEEVMNNHDRFLRITREIDLCLLIKQKEIMFNLIP